MLIYRPKPNTLHFTLSNPLWLCTLPALYIRLPFVVRRRFGNVVLRVRCTSAHQSGEHFANSYTVCSLESTHSTFRPIKAQPSQCRIAWAFSLLPMPDGWSALFGYVWLDCPPSSICWGRWWCSCGPPQRHLKVGAVLVCARTGRGATIAENYGLDMGVEIEWAYNSNIIWSKRYISDYLLFNII